MGCNAIGVDIAPTALRLAEQLAATSPPRTHGSATFKLYDGRRLPVPDASIDRVLCFDSFHHVRDQGATLMEFARVLREGGRVVMVEPGPHHSKTAQSQEEMRQFNVIENDVVASELAGHAVRAGLSEPTLLVRFQRPLQLSLDEFLRWESGGVPIGTLVPVARRLHRGLADSLHLFMTKGEHRKDSRNTDELSGELRLLEPARCDTDSKVVSLRVVARNTGAAAWLTGASASPGTVNLGMQLLALDGSPLQIDYYRVSLPGPTVEAGDEVVLSFSAPLPSASDVFLRLALVAEQVVWFTQLRGFKPVIIDPAHL